MSSWQSSSFVDLTSRIGYYQMTEERIREKTNNVILLLFNTPASGLDLLLNSKKWKTLNSIRILHEYLL